MESRSGQGWVLWTAAYRKEQVIVKDMETDPLGGLPRIGPAARSARRMVYSRFVSDRRVLGVFGIYWDNPRTPTPAQYRLIDQMTHLASVAIERQRSQEAIRASERFARGQADVLTRTLDKLTRESDFDRIADNILRALTSQLDACSSGVWLVNGTTGLMDFEFALERDLLRSKSDAMLAAINPSLPVDAVYPWPEVFSTGKPVVLDDIREGPDFPWRSHLLGQGIITILIVPMFVAGEAAGVIGICFQQKREFRAEEIELAQALANQAMLALQLTGDSRKKVGGRPW